MGLGEGAVLQKASTSFDQSIAVRPATPACWVLRGGHANSAYGNRPQSNAGRQQRDRCSQEIFSIFVGGGSLVIVPPGSEKDTQHMARMCKKHDVAACILVPSLLEALLRVRPMPPSCCQWAAKGLRGL